MDEAQRATADLVVAGWDALRAGEWKRAKSSFVTALSTGDSAEAYEGLGWAAYCLDDDPLTFDSRERAFRSYRERGDDHAAARVAAWLAADWAEFRGETAVCNGWLQRAHRLLDSEEPGPGHAWLAVHEASMVIDDDPGAALRLAVDAADLGRRFGVVELEMLGLALEGRALVSLGDVDEGMRRLDEATATALGGDAELLSCVAWACCYLVSACEQVRDYDRASQWCRQVGEFCERHGIGFLLGICRAKYAGVLTWQGRWDEAEAEVNLAADGLASRPPFVEEALVRLAELRRLQGRFDDAEELFDRCEGSVRALLGRAALAADRGCWTDAAELAERFLRRHPEPRRIERAPGLEVAVRAYAAQGDHERAVVALEELKVIAVRAQTRPLLAAAAVAEAVLAQSRGETATARARLEDAIDLLAGSPARHEVGRARIELAAVLLDAGRLGDARVVAEAAVRDLRALGARGEVARAETMLAGLTDATPSDADGRASGPLEALTARECEVLTLVAEGLTNREIALRLVVSQHTVHRHVNSILRKLGLPSRAAAASVAVRHGLA